MTHAPRQAVKGARVYFARLDRAGHAPAIVDQREEVGVGMALREMEQDALSPPIAGQPVVYERDPHAASLALACSIAWATISLVA